MGSKNSLAASKRRFLRELKREQARTAALAEKINSASAEGIARAMEQLPTEVLEWAVRFEALAHHGRINEI